MRRLASGLALLGVFALTACADDVATPVTDDSPLGVSAARSPVASNPGVADEAEAAIRALVPQLEAKYGVQGAVVHSASWMGDPDQEDMGGTIFFNDRGNKQIPIQWVPGDPRRNGRTNIKYATDIDFFAPLPAGPVDGAIDRAMATWNSVACSQGLAVEKTSIFDPDFDIVHAGLAPLGGTTLAATFIFVWLDANGPTDIDGDGNLDYAFAVILYTSQVPWAIDADFDIQTVALHEAGHGLGQNHFGKGFLSPNGKLHLAPRAVMNATYSGVQQELTGTDNGGHCSMWGSWPNN